MKKMKLFSLISALLLALFLTACGSDNQTKKQNESKDAKTEVQAYKVKDDTGAEITFDKVPETVVSLQPSNTEILFELGVGDKLVGVTDYDNYPEKAKEIKRVSDSVNVNTEEVIALKPDVVIAYTIGDEKVLQPIKDAGIPIFVIQSAATIDDVYGDIEQLAAVMGVEKKGKEIISHIKEQFTSVQEKVASIDTKAKVYYEISPSPDIYTTGAKTFQQEILDSAGVENIFADKEGWMKPTEEEIIKRNPQVILTTVNYIDNPVDEIKNRKSWNNLDAVKNNQVIQLDADIMSRPGPRIGEAVELVAKAVYPDLFK
ncbi:MULTISPECIES: ABC transporter substrate-binding protein [Bacillus]|uniref:ABC transporter substrate-binding protein n=1 Tax=Bacillus TaxID=1386 RepID=UPI0002E2A848|nr:MULTISPECIES: ABC transporter substrate-binding protein [Bacillus]